MLKFWERSKEERELIKNAYAAEIELIDSLSSDTNPYYKELLKLSDGKDIWEAINFAIELKYNA